MSVCPEEQKELEPCVVTGGTPPRGDRLCQAPEAAGVRTSSVPGAVAGTLQNTPRDCLDNDPSRCKNAPPTGIWWDAVSSVPNRWNKTATLFVVRLGDLEGENIERGENGHDH